MFKQIILHFLNQLDNGVFRKNTLRVIGKLERHARIRPNSAISISYEDALEELDTVEEFEEDPEKFWDSTQTA